MLAQIYVQRDLELTNRCAVQKERHRDLTDLKNDERMVLLFRLLLHNLFYGRGIQKMWVGI